MYNNANAQKPEPVLALIKDRRTPDNISRGKSKSDYRDNQFEAKQPSDSCVLQCTFNMNIIAN